MGPQSAGWRPWLDTVLPAAARASELAAVIAEVLSGAVVPGRVIVRRSQFLFQRGGAARPSPRSRARSHRRQLVVELATALFICILWLRAGGSSLLRAGLPHALRHGDPAWPVCVRWGRAASRLDPAEGWDHGRGRLRAILSSHTGKVSRTSGNGFL